jgi:hypothetical protein
VKLSSGQIGSSEQRQVHAKLKITTRSDHFRADYVWIGIKDFQRIRFLIETFLSGAFRIWDCTGSFQRTRSLVPLSMGIVSPSNFSFTGFSNGQHKAASRAQFPPKQKWTKEEERKPRWNWND